MNTTIKHEEGDFLTRSEVAEIFGCKSDTLSSWSYKKLHPLPCVKIRNVTRYKISDLQVFIDNNIKR